MKNFFIDLETLESQALDQFNSAMELDCSIKGALMPDAHAGYSLPIGAVVATEGMVFPSWVGYDIGCGMCACRLPVSKKNVIRDKDIVFDKIYEYVPVGFNHHDDVEFVSKSILEVDSFTSVMNEVWNMKTHPFLQLGTLGGGNHFIEIGYDEDDHIWVIIHSGSRGFGWNIARKYMELASGSAKAVEGHYGFDIVSDLGAQYLKDMNLCLDFALDNRKSIMNLVFKAFGLNFNDFYDHSLANDYDFINRNHNHATYAPDGSGLIIHRKGATHAENGMFGVIPGNMRDGSFIVRGKGNPDSLWSSSHGAGRVLGRKAAKRELNLDDFVSTMGDVKAKVEDSTLDESPMAYKNIFDVMESQKDLVEVIHHIKPLINIKG